MTDTRAQPDPGSQSEPAFSAAALAEWSGHVDALLRGVAHALQNRAAALAAAIQLAGDPDDGATVVGTILEPELERVTELAIAVRAVGAPRAGDEAFSPRDVAHEALGILQFHAEQREYPGSIDARGSAPARTQRWMFVRALVVLAASGRGVRVTIHDDGDWIVIRGEGVRAPSPYVAELSAAMGGAALDDGAGFRVPTLAAIRRREGR